ncbi:MAG: SH3 domain-containing protein [Bacteroidales bacterium]|nr:SH3 domain-containing protein [Bacteroidales bacterium]
MGFLNNNRRGLAVKIATGFLVIILFACKNRESQVVEEKADLQDIPSVCIWDRISVRNEPVRKAPVISNLNLGESVTYLGNSAVDSSYKNQVYCQIRLSDERTAWVPAFSLVTGAKPAVLVREVPVYLRPDLLTITDRSMGSMEIVAVAEESDDWIRFYSEKKKQDGWIKSDALSFNKEDIAFSLYAGRILNAETSAGLAEKIDSILKYNLYPNSVFVSLLEEIGKKENERIQIEEIVRQNFLHNND